MAKEHICCDLNFPEHSCEMTLTHNEHKMDHQHVAQFIQELEMFSFCGPEDWPSAEAKQRAIDTNEIWVLVWYPDNPIAERRAYAPTLHELLRFVSP